MSRVSEQNALEATMTMLDSYCPTIRVDLERMLKGEAPNETKRAKEQTTGKTDAQNGETGNLGGEEVNQTGETEKVSEETVDSAKELVEANPNESVEVPIVDEKLSESKESNESNASNASNNSNNSNEGEAIAVVDEKEKESVAASEVFVEPSQSGESESAGSMQEEKAEEAEQTPEIPAEIIHVQDSE